ncbi:OmpA family protein [Saccharopolyspora sp. TS4A08]|uniref:OmpA family protein n=1 Tax=Saccharopolyspora ipomoeae TaxID=3042027 RepID=A0ABT6PTP3_9PSEU|nr:OmpA family protein [Saccharopolyspora sp. TS4A08]MDI2031252.1 OmpA family protein [Saccharopolyspora sp. TS4A08]
MIACTGALLAGCAGGPEGGSGMPPQQGQEGQQPGGAGQGGEAQGGEQTPGGMGAGEQGGDAAQAKTELQGKLDQLAQSTPITFDPDSSELNDQGKQTVTQVADLLKSAPQELKFTVSGFTASGTNSDQDSQQLSQARAQAVADQLAQAGIGADRLQVSGQGDAGGDPASSRKVEVKVQ